MGDLFKEEIKNYVDSCNDAKSITGKMVMNHLYEKFSSSKELIKEQKQQLLQYATEQIGEKYSSFEEWLNTPQVTVNLSDNTPEASKAREILNQEIKSSIFHQIKSQESVSDNKKHQKRIPDKQNNLSEMEFKLLSLLNEENEAIAPITLARKIFVDGKATKKQVNPDLYRLENKKLAKVTKNEHGANPMWTISSEGRTLLAKT